MRKERYSECVVSIIHSVADYKVINRDLVHSHALPWFPVNEGVTGGHETKGADFFSDAVYLCFCCIWHFKRKSDIQIDFPQIIHCLLRVNDGIDIAHMPNSLESSASTSSKV